MRYLAVTPSQSGFDAFAATVVDSGAPAIIVKQHEYMQPIAECYTLEDAEAICEFLNSTDDPDDMPVTLDGDPFGGERDQSQPL